MSLRPPLSPQEGWLSDGRQVLRFTPTRWDRWDRRAQELEITSGELLPDQAVPFLKNRREISREEAIRLWATKCKEGAPRRTPTSG